MKVGANSACRPRVRFCPTTANSTFPFFARQPKRTKEVQKRPEKGKKSSVVTQPVFPSFSN